MCRYLENGTSLRHTTKVTTNRQLHMRFRLAPKSITLDDLKLLQVQIFSEFRATSHFWEATTAKRMQIKPHS